MAKAALAQETLCALRAEISRLESVGETTLGRKAREGQDWRQNDTEGRLIRTGAESLDAALGGGLDPAGLYEIRTAETRDNGAASAFALALGQLVLRDRIAAGAGRPRILWIADRLGRGETGHPYAPGLVGHGLSAGTLIQAMPRQIGDGLMIAEAALGIASFAAVIFEVYGNPRAFGLTESRRLHLRARAHRRPLFVLRERGEEEASSSLVRFLARPAPSRPPRLPDGRDFAGGIGRPAFHIEVEKSRSPARPEFFLEWNADDCLLSCRDRLAVSATRGDAHPLAQLPATSHRPDLPDPMGTVVAFGRAS
jgi:protein ImuA